MSKKYSRVLLKLSGEQLAGGADHGIDPEYVAKLATEIKDVVSENVGLVIVVGGGNFIRGATFAGHGIDRAPADYMGMLATILNGMALSEMLEHAGIPTRLMTTIEMKQITEPFIRKRALRHLDKDRVIVIAGGTGKPYVTTDTASVSYALELNCDVVLKATNVDGVYDKDPNKHDDAQRFETVDFEETVKNPDIKVMDKAALGLAMENDKPIIVFDVRKQGNLGSVAAGEHVGTLVS